MFRQFVCGRLGPVDFLLMTSVTSSQAHYAAPLNLLADVAAARQRLAGDRYRPLYHYVAPEYQLKDPNGLIYYKGNYHLFYQNNPWAIADKDHHWGHAVSRDLVHWTDLPVALRPARDGPNAGGCWSGCIVLVDGVPTAVYYGHPSGICISQAHPMDTMLVHWQLSESNPIVPNPPASAGWRPFDPEVWKQGDTWQMICGGSQSGRGDTAFLLTSKDFRHWEYQHEFYECRREWTEAADDCAVPDFFALEDMHALVFSSHKSGAQYYLGRYGAKERKFYPLHHDRLTHNDTIGVTMESGNTIAPATLVAPDGRRVLFSWMGEGRARQAQEAAGWCGIMTLPRVLTLGDDNALRMHPVRELECLRDDHQSVDGRTITEGADVILDNVRGTCLEIAVVLDCSEANECGLALLRSPDGEEQTIVRYDAAKLEIALDASSSSLSPDVLDRELQHASLVLSRGERLRWRIFVDRSVVEVYANERRCLAKRVYPTREDSHRVSLFARGGPARLVSFEAWSMKPIWPTDGSR